MIIHDEVRKLINEERAKPNSEVVKDIIEDGFTRRDLVPKMWVIQVLSYKWVRCKEKAEEAAKYIPRIKKYSTEQLLRFGAEKLFEHALLDFADQYVVSKVNGIDQIRRNSTEDGVGCTE